jgi:two-component sensor histidine kinase
VIGAPVSQGSLDWRIIMALPESRFLAPLETAERRAGFISAAAFLAALLVAFLIAHSISLPLHTLGAAATAFAAQIDQQVDDPRQPHARDLSRIAGRNDELGRLASSFTELRSRLTEVFRSLNASLGEKDVLLREIHHRVKNNLQVVSSLISLQEGKFDDPSYVDAMQTLQDRVRAMAIVHETIYSSGDYVSVHMDDYLLRVTDSLGAYRSGDADVSLSVIPGDVRLPLEQAIPCGLIAVELATNAIKHAFPGRPSGRIELSIRPENDAVVLTVEDDGVGIEGNVGNPTGVGSLIVSALASQLRGVCAVVPGTPGTRAEVRFPVLAS